MTRFFSKIILLLAACLLLWAPAVVSGQGAGFRPAALSPAGAASPGRGASPRAGSTGPVDISADFLEYDKAADVYIAKGRVEIREGARILNADFVRYDKVTEDAYAEGNVVFREGQDVINCDKMTLNMVTQTGIIEKGKIFIKQGNFNIIGSEIVKLGENEYEVKKGQFTTCDIEGPSKPAWKFTADNANVTINGYAKTKGMRFYILDRPVFYIPAGFFPVKTDRQSGLLMPELITSSRDGFKMKESFFWAISKDKDATFYTQYIQNRGFLMGTEFRYALREDMKGVWEYSIISDRDYGNTRYELKGRHEQVIGKDLTFKTNVDYVSDKDYILDFALTPAQRSEDLLKSTAYVERPFKKSLLTVETAYFRNLTTKDNDTTFKYLPHATFFTEYVPLMKNRAYTDFYSDLTNFYRERGDKVTRFGIEPRFRMPYSWKGINLLLNTVFYETGYLINRVTTESGSSTAERHTVRIEGDSNVQLLKNFSTDFLRLGQVQSLIKPQLKYTFIPPSSSSGIPTTDPYDNITQQNTVTYSFNHYLYSLTRNSATEFSVLEISQTYGLSGALKPSVDYKGSGNRLSDISAKMTFYPGKYFRYVNQTVWSATGDGLKSSVNTFSYTVPREYFVSLYHTYTTSLTNETLFSAGGTIKDFDLRTNIRYSFTDKDWIETLYQLVYHPGCWSLNLALVQSKRPRDTTFRLSIDLAGITRTAGTGGIIP